MIFETVTIVLFDYENLGFDNICLPSPLFILLIYENWFFVMVDFVLILCNVSLEDYQRCIVGELHTHYRKISEQQKKSKVCENKVYSN